MEPQTRFCSSADGTHIAYATLGAELVAELVADAGEQEFRLTIACASWLTHGSLLADIE